MLCPSASALCPWGVLHMLGKLGERLKCISSWLWSLWLGSAFLQAVKLPDVHFVWGFVPGLTLHSSHCCPGLGTSISPVPTGTEPGGCSCDKASPSKTDQSSRRLFFFFFSKSINSVKIQPGSSSTFMLFLFCRKPSSLLSGVCLLPSELC